MSFFFKCLSEAPRTRFGVHLEGDSDSKMAPKIQFQGLFPHTFFLNILLLIFDYFGRLRTLIIALPPAREHDFCKIRVFKKELKQVRFGGAFWQSKPFRIAKNSIFGAILPSKTPSKCTPKRIRGASERHLKKKFMHPAGNHRNSAANQAHAASTRLCIYQVI